MKKFIPLLIVLAVIIAGMVFYLNSYQTEKTAAKSFVNVRPLVSTSGWKEYSTESFSIKYPPNYTVNDQRYISNSPSITGVNGVITITEVPDNEILSGGAYVPAAWTGVEIFSPVEFNCSNPYTCNTNDKAIMNRLNFFPTEWDELMLQLDGHSPTESGTSRITIGGKHAVNRWFVSRAGIEGFPLSESNLYIRTDEAAAYTSDPRYILPFHGFARRDAEKNLAIIETMYSTIVFHE